MRRCDSCHATPAARYLAALSSRQMPCQKPAHPDSRSALQQCFACASAPSPRFCINNECACSSCDVFLWKLLQYVSVSGCDRIGRRGIRDLLHGPVTSRSLVELNHSNLPDDAISLNPRVMRWHFRAGHRSRLQKVCAPWLPVCMPACWVTSEQ